MKRKKVAIIGTNGLPSKYGGFETLVDNLTLSIGNKFDFSVYCSKTPKRNRLKYVNNARLIYLPFKANGWQSIIYDILSTFHAWIYADILLILGPVAGFILPLNKIFKKKLIVNHGGLNEWEREKFSLFSRFWVKINYRISGMSATYNIADSILLKESLMKTFGVDSKVIRCGGDHAQKKGINHKLLLKYPFLNDKYAVSVSRAQIDNNLHIVLKSFEKFNDFKLVIVSNWNVSKYGRRLRDRYKNHSNIILLDAIYDNNEINAIRGNAFLYIHSHSRCGTSPSLVEAMCLKIPVICYDAPTNRETTHNKSIYFKNSEELHNTLQNIDSSELKKLRSNLVKIANEEYTWEHVGKEYEKLFNSVRQ